MNIFSKKQSDMPKRRSLEHDENTAAPSSSNIFKRNRTLTGTTSNHLSTTNTKTHLESPRTHAHNLSIQRRKATGILLLVIVAAVPMWILISNFTASVRVSLPDTAVPKTIEVSKYEKAIQNYLDINPMSRLTFLLDQPAMSSYLSSKLPEISKIRQREMKGLGVTNFEITMRKPVAGWKINNKQFFVDSNGVPFDKNYFPPPSVQIVDNSGISLKIGTTAIASNRFLSFVGRVVYLTSASGYTITQAALPTNTTRELEVHLKEGNNTVKLSIDRPAGEQVEDMIVAVKYFASHGQSPQYIDVRVGGKAFYK